MPSAARRGRSLSDRTWRSLQNARKNSGLGPSKPPADDSRITEDNRVAASSATWRWSSATAGKPSGAEMRNHASRTVASKLPGSMTLTRSETGKAIVENMLIVQPWLASFLCEGLGNRCTGSALL